MSLFISPYVFSCLGPTESQLLLEEVAADLVAAGQHDPGPGGQEVPVDPPHRLRIVHEAPGGPQGVSVHSLDVSENRKTVLTELSSSLWASNLLS